jgi:ATP-binding cassette subfamily B protein
MTARRRRAIELRSATPGRERWVAATLTGRPDLVDRIERLLSAQPGVRSARANSATGTFLIEFEDESPMMREPLFSAVSGILLPWDDPQGEIALRSELPGRQRWVVSAIAGNAGLAVRAQRELLRLDGVAAARVSAVTGSVVLEFDPTIGISAQNILRCVRAAGRYGEHAEFAESEPPHHRGLQASTCYLAAGAMIVVPRMFLGASVAASPLLMSLGFVGAAVITSYGVYQYLREHIIDGTATGRTLRRLTDKLRPFRRQFLIASIFSIVRKAVDFAPPIFIGMAVNIVTGNPSALFAAIGISSLAGQITALGITAWLVYVFESTFEYLYKSRWRLLAQDVQHHLRVEAYAHAQLLQMQYLEGESTGALTTALNENINQLQLFLDDGVNALLEIATNIAVIVVAFSILAPSAAWIALPPVPVIAWVAIRYQKRIVPIYETMHRRSAQISSLLVNNFIGINTIRSFGTEKEELRRLEAMSAGYRRTSREAISRFAAFEPTARIPIQTAFATIVIAGGHQVLAGRISSGAFASTLFLLPRFLFPFAYLGQTIDRYQRAMSAMQSVFDLMDKPIGPSGGDIRLPRDQVRGAISFENVAFAYSPGEPILQHLSLDIAAGETIGVVGQTGSGKTTLVKLLLRFYDTSNGRILLDGHDVSRLDSRDLRNAIGLVGQDVFLLDGTIRENIAYGSPRASMEDIERAAGLAEAIEFIERLPAGFDTKVGERGSKLSGGQRQRLSLARAILKDPPVLVLDEATAALDNETEAAIQKSLAKISRGRTTIVIAHRLSTIRHADRIIVLGTGGTLLESDTHERLLQLNGSYASLWRVQTGEEMD